MVAHVTAMPKLEASQPFGTAVAVFGVAILAVQAVVLLRSGTRHGRGRAWWTSHRTSTGLVAIDDPDPTASHRQGRGVLRPPRRHGRPRREGPAGGADLHQPPCRDRRDAALARFTLYTLFGCLPWTFALAAAGDALASKWDSVTSYFTVASVVAIIAVATRWLLKVRGHRTRQIAAEPDRSPT